jgi:hypothetical protein
MPQFDRTAKPRADTARKSRGNPRPDAPRAANCAGADRGRG